MELKEVIQQILPHYEKALIEMPKEGHYEWLSMKEMRLGLCKFSKEMFNEKIVIAVDKNHTFIKGDFPQPNYTYQQNLEQIQNRVDWMREYLSKN